MFTIEQLLQKQQLINSWPLIIVSEIICFFNCILTTRGYSCTLVIRTLGDTLLRAYIAGGLRARPQAEAGLSAWHAVSPSSQYNPGS